MATRKKRNKGKNIVLTFLGIIIIGLIVLLGLYLTPNFKFENNNSDVDKNAVQDKEDNEEKMEVSEGGGAASITYSNIINIKKEEKQINLYLKNPNKSREKMILEIMLEHDDKEIKIGESKLIPPGYEIRKLSLSNEDLEKGNYKGYIKVYFVSEKTNKKEIVDTKINVDITVE